MAAKIKGNGKIRIKSVKQIILSVSLILTAVVVIFIVYNVGFSKKSIEVIAEPVVTSARSENATNETDVKAENSKRVNVANTSDFSHNEAMNEIGESIVKNKDIRVKVVNHSRKSGLSERIRLALEVNGFIVSAGNDNSLKGVSSVIIEKKDNISGEGIMKLISVKRIRKELDLDSRFDIIVILGDDY
jgi:hypothetical protein